LNSLAPLVTIYPDQRMNKTNGKPDQLLVWMGGLADETRLRLLNLLEKQELGVEELREILQMPQSTVSRHLQVLAKQNWVRPRRLAQTRFYRMDLDELDSAARKLWLWAREHTEHWATLQQDELRLQRRLREREIDSAEFFAGAAVEWDRLRRELYGDDFTAAALLALLPRDLVVADLGCGSGAVMQLLAPHVKQVIGIDNSPAMLKAAKKRLADVSNADLRKGDLLTLPLEDSSCDAALLLLALTYVADPATVLSEMHRVIKPGGKAVIVDLLPHDRDAFRRQMGQLSSGFAPGQMKALLGGAGFEQPGVTEMPPEPEAKGPALFLATAMRNG
jgi:ArsR family transcriptional regulator